MPVPCPPLLPRNMKSVCVNFRAVVRTRKPLGVGPRATGCVMVYLVDRGAWKDEPEASACTRVVLAVTPRWSQGGGVGGPLCLEGTSESWALPSGLRAGPVPALCGRCVQCSDLGRFPRALFGGDFTGI